MIDILALVSQFIFLFLFASFLSFVFLIAIPVLQSFLKSLFSRRFQKQFEYELANFVFSSVKPEKPARFPSGGVGEDLLERQLLDPRVTGEKLSRLAFLWRSLGYPEKNIRRLKSGKEAVRIKACQTLGLFCHESAKHLIREMLHEFSEKVRWAATFALFRMRDEKSLHAILESLGPSGRFSLVQLQPDLFSLGKEGIFSIEEALGHPEPEVRMLALGIVARLKQAELARLVGKLANDPVLDVRMKALGALAALHEGHLVENSKLPGQLESLLRDRLELGTWEEVARILQVIGAWKLVKFIPEVEHQVTHLHPWVRYRAFETLLQLGPEGKKAADDILSEYQHIIFPIYEDLGAKKNVQE